MRAVAGAGRPPARSNGGTGHRTPSDGAPTLEDGVGPKGPSVLLSDILANGFRWLSRLRGKRVFHPEGVAFRSSWRTEDREALAGLPERELDAVVRLSRGAGLPDALPDVLGLAIKVLDAGGPGDDLDLLLARTGSGPVGRRLLAPARDFTSGTFSSLLPYAAADGREGPVTATITEAPTDGSNEIPFETVRDRQAARLTVALSMGDGRRIASVAIGDRMDDELGTDLRFDPSHDGGPLRPTGFLNRLRKPVYSASQDGRGAPARGARPRLDRERP